MEKRIYVKPMVEFDDIEPDTILAGSGNNTVEKVTNAEWKLGNGEGIDNRDENIQIGYGDALSKGFGGIFE